MPHQFQISRDSQALYRAARMCAARGREPYLSSLTKLFRPLPLIFTRVVLLEI